MKLMIETIKGVEGNSLSIGNMDDKGMGSGRRIAGPKPWGGGSIIDGFEIYPDEIIHILKEIYAVYPDDTKKACEKILRIKGKAWL